MGAEKWQREWSDRANWGMGTGTETATETGQGEVWRDEATLCTDTRRLIACLPYEPYMDQVFLALSFRASCFLGQFRY